MNTKWIFIILLLQISCMDKRANLIKKVKNLGFPDNEIVVTLEDFFDGNSEEGSIGPNIYPNQPSPEEFYNELNALKSSGTVDDIYVRIADIEDPPGWPYTDAIYIISDLSKDKLSNKLKKLYPDEIYEGWMYGKPVNSPIIKTGLKVYSVWWD